MADELKSDAEILDWIADEGLFEGITGVEKDIHEYACDAADKAGSEMETSEECRKFDRIGLRMLISAAIAKGV